MLDDTLKTWEDLYGTSPTEVTLELRFKGVVQRACEKTGNRTVILVDEYDKPLLQSIGNEALQNEYRSTLKAFYSVLKTQDRYIKFAFLTGVTKFSKVSFGSDTNNLQDISSGVHYAGLCGITEDEITYYFKKEIEGMAEKNGISTEEVYKQICQQSGRYRFWKEEKYVYNPANLLGVFSCPHSPVYPEHSDILPIKNLLSETKAKYWKIVQREGFVASLNGADFIWKDPVLFLYQLGFLTIKGYNSTFDFYILDFPNLAAKTVVTNFLQQIGINFSSETRSVEEWKVAD